MFSPGVLYCIAPGESDSRYLGSFKGCDEQECGSREAVVRPWLAYDHHMLFGGVMNRRCRSGESVGRFV